MQGKSALQVLLCIDLEPDQLYPVPGQEETWEGSRAAFAWAKRWRAAGPGRHITWFLQMDDSILERHGAKGPEVLFRDELAACRAAGDAFGVHLHLYRRRQDGTWLNDLQDDAWIVANLRAALRRFEAWNGGPCRHFSVGDNLLTPAIQDALEQAGVWYDYTAIPDYDATATMTAREGLAWRGRIPNARGMPRKPYQPRRGNSYRAALWPRRTALRMIPGPSGSLGRGIAGRWALTFSSDTAESERVLASWLDEVGGILVARTRSDHFLDRLQAIDTRLDFLARRSQGVRFTTADRVPGLAPPA